MLGRFVSQQTTRRRIPFRNRKAMANLWMVLLDGWVGYSNVRGSRSRKYSFIEEKVRFVAGSEVCFSRLCDLVGRRWRARLFSSREENGGAARPSLFFRCEWKSPRRMFFYRPSAGFSRVSLAVIFRSKNDRSLVFFSSSFDQISPPPSPFLTSLAFKLFIGRFPVSSHAISPDGFLLIFPRILGLRHCQRSVQSCMHRFLWKHLFLFALFGLMKAPRHGGIVPLVSVLCNRVMDQDVDATYPCARTAS